MLLRRISALLLAATAALAADDEGDKMELRQLNGDNFKATVAHGAWLVEHYSPRCWHCKAFAPTWTELAEKKAYHEKLTGFHMAQVNCIAQGDLCNANDIGGYPTLLLYADGKKIEEYKLDRAYPILDGWIEEKALAYARGEPLGGSYDEDREAKVVKKARPNPEGKVVEVDEAGLDQYIADGPVFVDFFAPWCTHCKKLRPQYEKLAAAYKGMLNIIAVNCDENGPLCRRNGVHGYPTIKLFNDGDQKLFEKQRTVDLMTKFLDEEIKHVPMQKIMSEDFDDISASTDIFYVYLTNYVTSLEETEQVQKAVASLGLSVPVFTTSDPLFYSNQSIANPPPTSALLAFAGHDSKHVAAIPLPASDRDLTKFVKRTQYPSYYELTSETYDAIFRAADKPLVVLGGVHDREDDKGIDERQQLVKMSRAWKKAGRNFNQRVLFVAADVEKWAKWLRKMVAITVLDIPALVVIDTAERDYYDVTIEGERARFDGADAFSLLEGVYQKFLTPKKIESGLEWGSRGTMMLFEAGQWSAKHPILATLALFTSVAGFLYLLSRCMARRPSHKGGYMNEKGGQRLD